MIMRHRPTSLLAVAQYDHHRIACQKPSKAPPSQLSQVLEAGVVTSNTFARHSISSSASKMTSWVGVKSSVTPSQVDAVARAIRVTPIVDNHAHPLLKPEALGKHPLLAITTEAVGDAIHAATTSLPHLRAVRQLATVLGCGFTWEAVVAAIEQQRIDSFEDWAAQCLFGIETILVDDGLDGDDAEHYSWHDDYTRSKCKRIVRIEKVAADIIKRLGKTCDASNQTGNDVLDDAYDDFVREFDAHITGAIEDPEVVAFKSGVSA